MTMCVNPIVPETANLRLTVAKATALRHLTKRIQQGVALRRRRVRYVEDLEDARAEKATWVQTYTDLLRQIFHGNAGGLVADGCNDWAGRVYPEYAEIELFVEQFYEEMDYRISRLREVQKYVSEMPDLPAPIVPQPQPQPHTPTEGKVTLVDKGSGLEEAVATMTTKGAAGHDRAAAAAPAAATPKRKAEGSPVTTAADIKQGDALATALLVSNGERSPASDSVRRFLADLGVDLVAIRATAQDGKSAVSVLEQGPAAGFAVLLLGPEDANNLRNPGACSPAITFQLGYLVGRLGLTRVCIMCEGGNEVFHDAHGILCLPLDAANGWHLQLARQLKRAGIEVDLNKLC